MSDSESCSGQVRGAGLESLSVVRKLTATVSRPVPPGTRPSCCGRDRCSRLQLLKRWRWDSCSQMVPWLREPVWLQANQLWEGGSAARAVLRVRSLHRCPNTNAGVRKRGTSEGVGRGKGKKESKTALPGSGAASRQVVVMRNSGFGIHRGP